MLAAGVPKKDIGVKLSQHAYKRFKEFLITGQIKTGAVMSQADLVRILDVPISPLREAVQVLESEGLVTVMPRSGIRIVQPDMEAIKNWFQLRHILEREAVSRYAISASTAEIDAWEQRHRQLGEDVDAGLDEPTLSPRAAEVDDGFHTALVRSLRNPIIDEVYSRTREQLHLAGLVRAGGQITPLLVKVTLAEHLRIIDALQRQDVDGAVAAMDEHMTMAMHRAMGI
jgi:DNA-binding GntR family transcriptional regulator